MIGRSLGRYQIEAKIGAGGMGEVYLARDPHLERDVAVKVLPQGAFANDHDRRRFRKEALALSRLSHPFIATIHDFDSADGVDFLVMEYVPGETLEQKLSGGRLPVGDAVRFAREIADGLAAAHDRGVVHRDLKPANLKITPDGHLKILDFGVAKLFRPAHPSVSEQRVTDTSARAGTLAYMSPEQILGESTGPQSDIFSLGVVMYEMLTGVHPFAADYAQSVAYNVLNLQPKPPSAIGHDIPDGLDKIVLRMLAKTPADRFQSGRDIASILGTGEVPSFVLKRKPRRILRLGMVILTFSLAAAATIYLKRPGSVYSAEYSQRVVKRLTFTGSADVPSWSPDGKEIAYFDNVDQNVYIIPTDGGTPRLLSVPEGFFAVPWGWTPDSRHVIANSNYPLRTGGAVLKLGLHGEEPQVLAERAWFGNVSHDGRYLAYMSQDPKPDWGIWVLDMTTGEKRKLVEPMGKGTATYKAKWSPDDREISYVRWNGRGHELWLVGSDGSHDRKIDTDPIEVGGQYCWSKDGRHVVIGGELYGSWGIWQISVMGGGHARLTSSPEEERHVSLAPDGKRFVFGRQRLATRIAVVDGQSGRIDYPVEMDIATQCPAISSDGSSVFFQVLINARWQIWKAPLSGEEAPRPVLAFNETSAFNPVSDGAGNLLYLRGEVGRVWRFGRIDWSQTLWRSSEDGGRHEQITLAGERVERIAPTPSRSGRLLFSINTPDNSEAICVLDANSELIQVFQDSDSLTFCAFDWGQGEDEVLIAHSRPGELHTHRAVSVLDIKTRQMQQLFDVESMAADGERPTNISLSRELILSRGRDRIAVLASAQREGKLFGELYIYNLARNEASLLHRFDPGEAPILRCWSPDDRTIVVDLNLVRSDIYVCGLEEETKLSQKH